VVTLCNEALSVSAVWAGNPHPTVDPRSAMPVAGPLRVAVVGPTARLADAWSTAVLVLGRRPPAMGPEWQVNILQPPT
jgi:thiamine biosynthesis lipoprotein ApbE